MTETFIICISGPIAAGKSFFTKRFVEEVMKKHLTIEILSINNFYYDQAQIDELQRIKYNFDYLDAIDKEMFIQRI